MPVPKVSIVIPTLNMLNLLQSTVEGIAKTCDVSFEVIVVNNGSSDNTKEWLETLAEQTLKQNSNFIKLIKIHNKQNQFLAKALNQGVLHSSGKYISVVMNDIIVPPRMYSFFVDFLEKDVSHKFGAVGPYYIEDPRFNRVDDFYNNYDKLHKVNEWTKQWHFSPCYIIRREDWDNVGGWDEHLRTHMNDNDIGWRYELFGLEQTSYKGIICYHAYGSFGRFQMKNESNVAKQDSRYFLKKWGQFPDKPTSLIDEKFKCRAKKGQYLSKAQLNYKNKIRQTELGEYSKK